MKNRLFIATCSLFLAGTITARAQNPEEATLYRDEFGIPHVYAPSLETAAFAVGYAQAEDRLEELLKNYRRASGTMAEVFGASYFREDTISRLFRHEEVSREKYGQLSPKMRAVIEAYQAGLKLFMREHPEQVPAWAQEIHPWDVVALGRFIIWGWPLGEAGGDLLRAGIQPDEMAYHGSNEMLLGPGRTAAKVPIAIIDPHLSWYGEFRFYQVRIYAGDFNASGVAILGTPLPSLGHSRYCSIAMTTGGPDTSDVFEEELNPDNPRQYRCDGQWKDLQLRQVKIGVKNGGKVDWKELELESSRHGPIVAHKNGRAYAMALPYAEEVGLMDQTYGTMTARNLAEMKRALGHLQLMGQNVMVATVQGDIYYVRNGRVPIRAPGTDPSRPIPGRFSTNDWRGIHPFADLVQIENPPQGYMQNCNVTPFGMMKDSPLTPEKYSRFPYLYNATRNSPRHQRAEMATELLEAAHEVTVEEAIALAFNTQVYHAEQWQARLKETWTKAPDGDMKASMTGIYNLIQKWNCRSDADSEGALAYYAFKKGFPERIARAVEPPSSLGEQEMMAALGKAADWLQTSFGSLAVPYGKYFRVGREGGERTYPVGGGSLGDVAMATVRAIGFNKIRNEMVGHSGQTSTQVVLMTDPPQSYSLVPLGASDHQASGHWDDQAERLFSPSRMTPTWFMNRSELLKHVTSTKILKPAAAEPAAKKPEMKVYSDPEQVDADFKFQGEYASASAKLGAQVRALGNGMFRTMFFAGGLPGDGWDGKTIIQKSPSTDTSTPADAKLEGKHVVIEQVYKAVCDGQTLTGQTDTGVKFELNRVSRHSPTLGAPPPPGAIVLFDGRNLDEWQAGAKMTPQKWITSAGGATTRRKFQDFTLHVEFMISYMPETQSIYERPNSGVYLQERYEIQLLDSFGVVMGQHDCGVLYAQVTPAINMCYPPLTWQTYDIDFTAARYDATGRKTKLGRCTVKFNGVTILDNVEILHSTPGGIPESPEPGSIYLQAHGHPIFFKNVWVVERK